jgi:hypothetical protein
MLCSAVHQGLRPDLNELPRETPPGLVQLIHACWDSDRSKRKSALECFALLDTLYTDLARLPYDVYICHSDKSYRLVDQLYQYLTQCGLTVKCRFDDVYESSESNMNTNIHMSQEKTEMNAANLPLLQWSFNTDSSWSFTSTLPEEVDVKKIPFTIFCLDQSFLSSAKCRLELQSMFEKSINSNMPRFFLLQASEDIAESKQIDKLKDISNHLNQNLFLDISDELEIANSKDLQDDESLQFVFLNKFYQKLESLNVVLKEFFSEKMFRTTTTMSNFTNKI